MDMSQRNFTPSLPFAGIFPILRNFCPMPTRHHILLGLNEPPNAHTNQGI